MKLAFANWSREARLAALAFVLGLVAVTGDPYGGGAVTINAQELATIVEQEIDHVTVQELADWIIRKKTDFRLIDVRDPESFEAYYIPGAENVPVGRLPDYPLERNETIVIYSDGGMHSAQAWFLLRAKGYAGAKILLYGLEEWKDRILFPALPESPAPDQLADVRRAREISAFFGGQPRTGGTESVAFTMPKVDAPAGGPAPAARKRKEGC
jgi:rhodanese-related sulfurtransferase